jgi:hypothetical protein
MVTYGIIQGQMPELLTEDQERFLMCTSFAVYTPKPIYGMNFDFPDVEVSLHLQPGDCGEIFYLAFEWKGNLHRTAGMNACGLFSAAQMLIAAFDITHSEDESLVSPYEVFSRSLQTGSRVEHVLDILGRRRLGYTSERKGHQLYADRYGSACILEPDRRQNWIHCSHQPYTVMTNRPIQKALDRAADNIARLRVDRDQTARKLIEAHLPNFGVKAGFEVLKETVLVKGRFTTQSSMVCDPVAGEVYLAFRRDFHHIWKLRLQEKTVETYSGFDACHEWSLDGTGITASQLQA